MNRGSTTRSESVDTGTLKLEMVRPSIATRMKKRDKLLAHRVDTREIWPLVGVAAVTRESQIVRVVGPTVLLGSDVFDVMSEAALLLAKEAILAAVTGSLSNQGPSCGIHQGEPFESRYRRAFNLRMAMKSSALM